MYACERCGTRFGRIGVGESCPRCLAREGVRVGLVFSLFEGRMSKGDPAPAQTGGLEEAVRREFGSRAGPARRGGPAATTP